MLLLFIYSVIEQLGGKQLVMPLTKMTRFIVYLQCNRTTRREAVSDAVLIT
jgi:hypothetical protein